MENNGSGASYSGTVATKGTFSENTRVQIPAALHLVRLGYTYLSRIDDDAYDHRTNIRVSEISDRNLNENLLPSITKTGSLLQTLVSSYSNIPDPKAVKAAQAHKNVHLQEATLWHLTKAVALFSAFTESLTTIQMALKDYNYAQLSQTDKEIKRIFGCLLDRYASEHEKELQTYISDVTSPSDAIHDLKSDYRTNPAVAQYIKSSSDLPKIIRNLRETHQTESILPDFLAFVTKYEALQELAKKQKKAAKSQPPIQATVNLNIDHFINNGTFTDNSNTMIQSSSPLKQIE